MSEFRFAQEYSGQRLHFVDSFADGSVSLRGFCGRNPSRRGNWRMTINVPLAHACRNCLRVWRARRGGER